MAARIGVIVMALGLVIYIAVIGQYAYALFASGSPVAIAMAVGLVVLPGVAVWALVRELQFGFAAQRLTRTLKAEGGLPEEEVGLLPSGRVVKDEAAPLLERYREEASASPDDWRAQLRLGLVQDATGDRKAARFSVREAIRVERAARP